MNSVSASNESWQPSFASLTISPSLQEKEFCQCFFRFLGCEEIDTPIIGQTETRTTFLLLGASRTGCSRLVVLPIAQSMAASIEGVLIHYNVALLRLQPVKYSVSLHLCTSLILSLRLTAVRERIKARQANRYTGKPDPFVDLTDLKSSYWTSFLLLSVSAV